MENKKSLNIRTTNARQHLTLKMTLCNPVFIWLDFKYYFLLWDLRAYIMKEKKFHAFAANEFNGIFKLKKFL